MPASRPLAALCLAALTSAALAQTPSAEVFEREGDVIFRVESGQRFVVQPDVVSARFGAEASVVLAELAGGDARLADLEVLRSNRLGIVDLGLPAGADPLEVVAALRASGAVEFAETNTVGRYVAVPDDPSFGSQWALQNTGQSGGTAGADVNAVAAWDLELGDPSVVIAVLDSGTDHTHPDLAANMWKNAGEIPGNGNDDDGNGLVDDYDGWDFDGGDNDPITGYFHGTAVAGVIGSVGHDGQGTAGLAGGAGPGTGCRVMPVCVGEFGPNGSILDDAIIYAADMGARVITLSLTVGSSAAIDAAIEYAHDVQGVFIDCASGNSSGAVGYPASHPDIMAVGSTTRFDTVSSFSNFGSGLEVAAPGSDILMTSLGGGYTTSSGTSFAAPHVAALAGLLLSADPGLTNEQVRTAMRATAVDIGDSKAGDGRIDALAALLLVSGGTLGSAELYGTGLAGLQGKVPKMGSEGGVPQIGNAGFEVTLTNARGSKPATLVLGLAQAALPFKGGTMLVDVTLPHLLTTVMTSFVLGSSFGDASVPVPIPADANLVGIEVDLQWFVKDNAAPVGYSMSRGLQLLVGG